MLDDILAVFRRRAPVRKRRLAVSERWPIDLNTMGGPIVLGRSDVMPRTLPRLHVDESAAESEAAPRAAQPRRHAPQHASHYELEHVSQYEPERISQHEPEPVSHRAPEQRAPRHVPRHTPQQATQHAYLAAHSVQKSFGGRMVVKGASLYVRRGEAVGLLGPNGAGKTTIFYMITGLIKADRGRIELDGHDVTALPMYQRARLGIGYLPQEASIFRGLSVEDNIRAVLEVVEPDRRRRERDLDALLEEFNIATAAQDAVDRAVGRRAPARRDRARAGVAAELHAARRAVRRHRSDRGRRPADAGATSDQPRHRRADHRPQCARNARA